MLKNMWACAECQVVEHNRKMFLPHRPQYTIPFATPKGRPTARTICAECELRLRQEEGRVSRAPCTVNAEDIRVGAS